MKSAGEIRRELLHIHLRYPAADPRREKATEMLMNEGAFNPIDPEDPWGFSKKDLFVFPLIPQEMFTEPKEDVL